MPNGKSTQGHRGNRCGLLAKLRDGGGFPKCGFSERAGNQQIGMRLAAGAEGAAVRIGMKAQAQVITP